jgi:hypothetical protein
MRHDWIFDVLSDLQSYAEKNALPRLSDRVSELLDVARAEIAAQTGVDPLAPAGDEADEVAARAAPARGRPH